MSAPTENCCTPAAPCICHAYRATEATFPHVVILVTDTGVAGTIGPFAGEHEANAYVAKRAHLGHEVRAQVVKLYRPRA